MSRYSVGTMKAVNRKDERLLGNSAAQRTTMNDDVDGANSDVVRPRSCF